MSTFAEKLRVDGDGAPIEGIYGIETEYGLSCDSRFGNNDPQMALLATAAFTRSHPGSFYENGSRQYVDVGVHPEYSTAEDTNVDGVPNRVIEGHLITAKSYQRIIDRWLESPSFRLDFKAVNLVANTFDAQNNSWGSHANVLVSRAVEPESYITALASHNLSRIVWSGAGKVQRQEDGNYQFHLSEKANHIWEVASSGTTKSRPLVNLRDEPLADDEKYRRIHDIAGETVFSPFVNSLRLASTAIILRACELGVSFADLEVEEPVASIHEVSRDPSLKQLIRLKNGRDLTAVELQQAIAERSLVAAALADYLTPQEEVWGLKWLEVLDDLATDPRRCIKKLDWLIKRDLVEREVEARSGKTNGRLESPGAIAWQKAIDFHRLLPVEGMGMKLLRKGFFEGSIPFEQIEEGLPLPDTRAKIRGLAIAAFISTGLHYRDEWHADWMTLELRDPNNSDKPAKFNLKEPHKVSYTGVLQMLERVVA